MDINVDKLNEITQKKYKELEITVKSLLKQYEENDKERFDLIKNKIAEKGEDWDANLTLISGDSSTELNIQQLLAYEYCLATEKITNGKFAFGQAADKLFDGIQVMNIGNPVKGRHDNILYGKGYDDESAVPISSKMYRIVMHAGAQKIEYIKDEKLTGGLFLFEKGVIKNFAHRDNGESLDIKTDGINFSDLSSGQSLLSNLRQTFFHESNHNAEKDYVIGENGDIPREYVGLDGKKYMNYQTITDYCEFSNDELIEPEYFFGEYVDTKGEKRNGWFYMDENGEKKSIYDYSFKLEKYLLDNPINVSYGLETREKAEDGTEIMHNIITEGFVEKAARAMVLSIDPNADLDIAKYQEYVAIAEKVTEGRDEMLGKGQTYADFLSNSSKLKKELEKIEVDCDNGTKTDGLHYLSDYADKVQRRETEKRLFLKENNMRSICDHLQLNEKQIQDLIDSNMLFLNHLSDDDKNRLVQLLSAGKVKDLKYIGNRVNEFSDILDKEQEFFDLISRKLGYKQKDKCSFSIDEFAELSSNIKNPDISDSGDGPEGR